MTERIFELNADIIGTQLAHPDGKKLQVDFPFIYENSYVVLDKNTAEQLGKELLRWAIGCNFNNAELFLQDYKKGFVLSIDCPRCELQIDLFSFRKREW